ncbi:sigma-54-dependent Fis family transcriptional regulator [Ammoniphilus sp. YIM 78166]|uniref:sigma-54 interaction domain-containing protein n=1 Tax=Ammoniphilus sp. YIM 78166 TaxID=1644106 RepID=UPI00106FB845|nr:sigma 54-interacting transcriptional regulator [Ammoniphilus sp. YIM 78166]
MLQSEPTLESLSQRLQDAENMVETLKTVLDSAFEGVVVIDAQGIIKELNQAYSEFLGIKREEAIGKHVTEVIENTKVHRCIETGIAERGVIQRIFGQDMVVHRIPIWRDGVVVGAIGMLIFQGVSEVYKILQRLQGLSRKAGDKEKNQLDGIIGKSPAITEIKRIASRAAKVPSTVLITGESGVGKEVFARAIHQKSAYADGKFVGVNCAAIPEQLLEAELFGYEEGAFTGAKKGGKPGKFQLAHKGTIFLDEIGDMPLYMQAKILRVLEERVVERVGGLTQTEVDVRIITATNKPLEEMVHKGLFRDDLFYRLNIIRLHIPALRERKVDIPFLIEFHMDRLCRKFGFEPKDFTKEAMEVLLSYSWPGNIRELVNTLELMIGMAEGSVIQRGDLPKHFFSPYLKDMPEPAVTQPPSRVPQDRDWRELIVDNEKEWIVQALIEEKGNKAATAKRLGIHRSTLYEKLKKYQL